MKSLKDRTLALAGVFQCANLVHHIALNGSVDEHDLMVAIRSTLDLNPASIDTIFGKVDNLRTGLHTLVEQLGDRAGQKDMHIARYVISLLHLQRKLAKRKDMLALISEGIGRAKNQSELFGITHENVLANLAGIYGDTISQIPPKIMVSGENNYLSQRANADKIRAILLAGIRSAFLWDQFGGSRWQILFKRKAFVVEAERLLEKEINIHLH